VNTDDPAAPASMLFDREPNQWGLRGDPFLWREMRHALEGHPMPQSVECLTRIIGDLYIELTGRPLSDPEPFRVPRLDRGGMSAGIVSPRFWQEQALPFLRQRPEDYRASGSLDNAGRAAAIGPRSDR
jgi:molybdenum cofactor cytidylyltransferase